MTTDQRQLEPSAQIEDALYHPFIGHSLDSLARQLASTVSRVPPEHRAHAARVASDLLQRFPKTDDAYLQLDLALIQSVARQLCGTMPAMVFPVYDRGATGGWAHGREWLPWGQRSSVPVHLIYIDRDEGAPPELLNYPWLIHEVVHYALSPCLAAFDPCRELAAQRVRTWSLASLAAHDPAGEQFARDFHRYWTPQENQRDWPHEIAVDTVCMVLMGPVYALTLFRYYENITSAVNAYQIEAEHIPIELRTQAMIQMGEHLGWSSSMEPLRDLQGAWARQWPQAATASRYLSLRDGPLIARAQEVALAFCQQRGIAPLTLARLVDLWRAAENIAPLEGTDLILAAWGMWQRDQGGPQYQAWQQGLFADYEP